MFNLAWALLTFFVVPVIVLEDTDGIRSILRESGAAFKETWGESVTASIGVWVVFLPAGIVGLSALGCAYFLLSGFAAYLVGATGLLILVAALVSVQVVGMVVRTALYRYATDDEHVGPFDRRDPEYVFPSKSR